MVIYMCPEDILFITAVRNKFLRGALASLKSCLIALLCQPDLTVGTLAAELGNLNAVGVTGFPGGRGQVAALSSQRQGGCGYGNGQQSQSSSQSSLLHLDLWHWLLDCGVSKVQVDRKPRKFLLDMYKQKSLTSSEQKSNFNLENNSWLLNWFSDLS